MAASEPFEPSVPTTIVAIGPSFRSPSRTLHAEPRKPYCVAFRDLPAGKSSTEPLPADGRHPVWAGPGLFVLLEPALKLGDLRLALLDQMLVVVEELPALPTLERRRAAVC
jgi:hypothetical protein